MKLFNSGWAAPYNPRGAEIIIRSVATPSQKFVFPLPDDPRFWLPSDTATINNSITIPANAPVGIYDVFLNLPDTALSLNRPEYSIRLGNKNVWESTTGYNNLLFQLTISNTTGTYGYNQNNLSVDIYPNPSGSELNVSCKMFRSGLYTITVTDVSGRLVRQLENVFADQGMIYENLNVSKLQQGIYFVRVIGEQQYYIQKFVKE